MAKAKPQETAQSGPEECSFLIRNALVITGDAAGRAIPDGAVAVEGNRIVAVGPEREIFGRYRGKATIDAGGRILHPGLIEPHFHIVVTTCRGLFFEPVGGPRPKFNYADWKAALAPEDEKASTRLSCLELMRQGYTMVVEPGTAFDTDAVADGIAEAGLRGSLCDPYLWDNSKLLEDNAFLGSPALFKRAPATRERVKKLLGRELKRNRDANVLVRGHVGLYGEGTASDDLLLAGEQLARSNGVSFQQHLLYLPGITAAETTRLGHSPLEHLEKLGVLSERATLVHMNMQTGRDHSVLERCRPTVIWCPTMSLGIGRRDLPVIPFPGLVQRGLPVAIAVDAAFDWTPADASLLAHLTAKYEGVELSSAQLLAMRTRFAARSIGMEAEIGSIEPGRRADLVLRSEATTTSAPGLNAGHAIGMLDRSGPVEMVMVDGRVVLRDGEPVTLDPGQVIAEARTSARKVAARLGG